MKEITEAGIKAKPIETTKAMKEPLAVASLYLSYSVIGNGTVYTLNLKFGFPVATFSTDSYMN